MSILPRIETALLMDDIWEELEPPSITLNSESNSKPSLKLIESKISGTFTSHDGDLEIISSDVEFELMCNSADDLELYYNQFRKIIKDMNKDGFVSAFESCQDETNENNLSYKKKITYKISMVV